MGKEKKIKGIIGVCGSASLDKKTYDLAVSLGREIGKTGYILACGGLRGTMEAVCKGAKDVGGLTIGIIPSNDKSHANPYVDIVIPTGIGEARNIILVQTADGIITVAGGTGTLSEIAFAWRLGKPIVAMETTNGWSSKLANQQLDSRRSDKIVGATSPEQAVEILISLMVKH